MKHFKNWFPVYLAAFGAWPLVPWTGHGDGFMEVVDVICHLVGCVLVVKAFYEASFAFFRENKITITITRTQTIKDES